MKFNVSYENRTRIAKALAETPDGYVVSIEEPKRNLDQNAAMWAALDDVSRQVIWFDQKLSPTDWKQVFTASLKKQRVVPGLENEYVVLGTPTSDMSKGEMSDLIELIHAFGAENGVKFSAKEKI